MSSMATPNQRIGYYFYPDAEHYTARDLETWLPILDSLAAHWLTVRATTQRAVPEAFIRGLKQAGIEPVIHIACPIGGHAPDEISTILPSYARWGVQYVVVFDRPNMQRSWEPTAWAKSGLVERFLDSALPVLQLERQVGLHPVFPPLEPGGDYWDTAFLEAALGAIARRGKSALLEDLTLSMYAWTGDHGLDWGAGGPHAWPEARPYHTPEGTQDQRGFRIFDWYSAIAQKAVERTLPMLTIAGGATFGTEPTKLGPSKDVELNLSIVRALDSGDVPADVLNFSFYLLAAAETEPEVDQAWFPTSGKPRPVVGALRDFLRRASKAPGAPQTKSLEHYILMPPPQGPSDIFQWASVGELAISERAAVGFSPAEAGLARKVTLVGDEKAISKSVEDALRRAGCAVERVIRQRKSKRRGFHFPLGSGASHG
jgi:hypothetical protein